MDTQLDFSKQMAERFSSLPQVVQDAITSADVQDHMRKLAETHKLHVDQWQILENNVMLTLLGFQPVHELPQRLQKDLDLSPEVAADFALSISETVFAPIRGEMEKSLSHPTAVQAAEGSIEAMRSGELAGAATEAATLKAETAAATTPGAPGVAPATPPAPPQEEKAVRGQVAQTYTGSASHERKSIEGDPYREQLI